MANRVYTVEEIAFFRKRLPGRTYKQFIAAFKARFGRELTRDQVSGAARRYWVTNGRRGREGLGREIGAEHVDSEGRAWVKTIRGWEYKHLVVWKSLYGSIPKGHCVIFGDGDKANFSPDNLVLISSREAAIMNKKGLHGGSAELTRTGQAVARLYLEIGRRQKKAKG